ncbi:hypothetical protein PTW35_05215 [Photobacterium sp. DA100]|uniref:hypothetical protein n=1 Tax=Photobacterium sp. DA100 TaxID=3027472 RepID=UPI0024785CE3|nr:hypothetical protein [Photobacterium sp. DA100]WEM43200.1 hypothetical protein PTW35_05215 [Photobacterium sp. DA100]
MVKAGLLMSALFALASSMAWAESADKTSKNACDCDKKVIAKHYEYDPRGNLPPMEEITSAMGNSSNR